MSHVKRILFWTILLTGSAVLFYLWSKQQIKIIEDKNMKYFESTVISTPIIEKEEELIKYYQISASSSVQILLQKDLDKNEWSTSTLKISTTTIDGLDFGFIYPNKNANLYQNCKYKISLNIGEVLKPNYIGVLLFDAGNEKEVDSKQSGLVHSLTLIQNQFLWSVGNIWPGEYYLLISTIDGQDVNIKSEKFFINKNLGESCKN